eukprot:SAG22_NODE_122_length_18920_cov_23.494076_28_plen_229_part_00
MNGTSVLPAHFEFDVIGTWSWPLLVGWGAGLIGAFELLNLVCNAAPLAFCSTIERIPVRGKQLEKFERIDHLYTGFNKLYLPVFVHHYATFAWQSPRVLWDPAALTFLNTVGAVVVCFVIYDFFYSWFHRILHQRWIYRFIHKHHHRQMAPCRGTQDAINEHPLEYLGGEYLHLGAHLGVGLPPPPPRLCPPRVRVLSAWVSAARSSVRWTPHLFYSPPPSLGVHFLF